MPRRSLKRPWTPEEDDALTAFAARGISRRAIAVRMKRTPSSIDERLKKLKKAPGKNSTVKQEGEQAPR